MGGLADLLGISVGGKGGRTDTDVGTIYWDDIERFQRMDEAFNRLNRMGPFGGWQYTAPELEYDEKGKPTGRVLSPGSQEYVITDPGMQAAKERMSRRLAGEGFDPYTPPEQVSAITDALMASRMGRMGLLSEQPQLAGQYGQRFSQRPGGAYEMATRPFTTPPPQGGTPPGGGQPPGGQPPPTGGRPPVGRPPGRPPYYHDPQRSRYMKYAMQR